jgi:hypothetical protein
LFGSISICSDRFPFVWIDFHLFGPISICSDRIDIDTDTDTFIFRHHTTPTTMATQTASATTSGNIGSAPPSAAIAPSSSLASSSSQRLDKKPFWHLTTPEIERWVRQLAPGVPNTGGMLFPARRTTSSSTADANNMADAHHNNDEEYFTRQTLVGNVLLENLTRAVNAASSSSHTNGGSDGNDGIGSVGEPDTKRIKMDINGLKATGGGGMGDIYQVLDPSFAKQSHSDGESNNTTELSTGAILSRITLGGLVNALSGVKGGVVDALTCIPLSELSSTSNNNMDDASKKEERKKHLDVVIDTAHNLSLKEVIKLARGLHRSIGAR